MKNFRRPTNHMLDPNSKRVSYRVTQLFLANGDVAEVGTGEGLILRDSGH